MYTYEQRITAVQLYIKYHHKAALVIRELGYPDRHMLVKWFKDYESTGSLHNSAHLRKQNIAVAMAVCEEIVRNTKGKQKRLLTRG